MGISKFDILMPNDGDPDPPENRKVFDWPRYRFPLRPSPEPLESLYNNRLLLQEITGHTNYEFWSVDQLLRVIVEIGGFTVAQAEVILKEIAKKRTTPALKHLFVYGALSFDGSLKRSELDDLWDKMCTATSLENETHLRSYQIIYEKTGNQRARHLLEVALGKLANLQTADEPIFVDARSSL